MSKNKNMPRGMGGLGGMNPAALQKQVEELQRQMLEAQQQLENEMVTTSAGGGMVTVTMNGHQKIVDLKIEKEAIQAAVEDPEMLQDLILAAVNDAHERSQQMAAARMNAVTGGLGLGLPGLGG
jgi:DNA-binding YbaB/EbfC family protein